MRKKHLTLICSTSSGTVTPLRMDSVADVMSLIGFKRVAVTRAHFTYFFCLQNLDRYLLDLVVTEEVKTWTQRITRAQRNESDRYVTHFILSRQNTRQKNAKVKIASLPSEGN